jgi:WD40 repeat protein
MAPMIEASNTITTSNTVLGDNFGTVLQAGAVHGDVHLHDVSVRRRPRTSAPKLARRPPWLAEVLGTAGVLVDDLHVITCLPNPPDGEVTVEFPSGEVTSTATTAESHAGLVVLRLHEPTSLTPAPLSTRGHLDGTGPPGTPVFDSDVEAVVGLIAGDGRVLPMSRLITELPWLSRRAGWRLDLDADFKTHWLPRARGSELQSDCGKWYFTGRYAARRAVCDWLATTESVLVVTGGPGSGKSALLAHLLVSADEKFGGAVPDTVLRPAVGAFGAAVHVSGLTRADVLARLGAAFDLDVETSAELVVALRERGSTVVLLIDAVEEAANPEAARGIAVLLKELADSGVARILAAVRTAPAGSDRERVLAAFGRSAPRIDLDSSEYLCRADVVTLIRHRLPALSEQDAHVVAERARYNFLIAQLTTTWLAVRGTSELRTTELPETVGQAMDAYLDACGPDTALVRRMLTALAFARGAGLARDDSWLVIADALHRGHTHTLLDLETVFHSAANYLVDRSESQLGQPSYRLYHHALDEHLQEQCPVPSPQHVITRAFTATQRWCDASHYALRHLPEHAIDADMFDELLSNADFLVHAEPSALLTSLPRAQTRQGHLISAAYRASHHLHQHADPSTRCRMIALDAARHGARALQRELNDLHNGLDRSDGALGWRATFATGQWITPALVATLKGHTSGIERCAMVAECREPVALTLNRDELLVWSLTERRQIDEIDIGRGEDRIVNIAATAWQGRPIGLLRHQSGTVRMWDVLERREIGRIDAPRGESSWVSVTVTEIDQRAVVITVDGDKLRARLRLWNFRTQKKIAEFHTRHFNLLHSPVPVTRSGASSIAALTNGNGMMVKIWDLAEVRVLGVITFDKPIVSVAVGQANGRVVGVAYGYRHPEITVWDLIDRSLLGRLPVDDGGLVISGTVTDRNGRSVLVAAMTDRSVRIWDLTTLEQVDHIRTAHHSIFHSTAAEVSGRLIALTTSNTEGTICVLDLESAPMSPVDEYNTGPVYTVAAAEISGCSIVATAQPERKWRLWNVDEQHHIADMTHGQDNNCIVNEVVTTTRGLAAVSLFSVYEDRSGGRYWNWIEFWDVARRRRIGPPVHPQPEYVQVAMADAGDRTLAVVCDDRSLRKCVLTAENWEYAGEIDLSERDRHVFAMAIGLQDDRQVVVTGGTSDGRRVLEVWDLADRCGVREIHTDHEKEIKTITLARQSGRLVAITAGTDKSVRAWDLLTGRRMAHFAGHSRTVTSVLLANVHNRLTVVSGSLDRTIRLWDLGTQECVEVVQMPDQILCMDLSERGTLVIGQGSDVIAMEASGLSALTPTQRPL